MNELDNLIPQYLSGALGDEETRRFEAALARDADLRSRVAVEQQVVNEMRQEPTDTIGRRPRFQQASRPTFPAAILACTNRLDGRHRPGGLATFVQRRGAPGTANLRNADDATTGSMASLRSG